MSNKTIKLIGLILLALVLLATILGIVEDIKKMNYFDEAQKQVDIWKKLTTWDHAKTSERLGVDSTWTTYVLFVLSPIALLIVGWFNWSLYKNTKSGSKISAWPLIVILVVAVLAILTPIFELVSFAADSKYSISNLADIKKDSQVDYDQIIKDIKPIYEKNTVPALGYVGLALTVTEGIIAIPTLIAVKKMNN